VKLTVVQVVELVCVMLTEPDWKFAGAAMSAPPTRVQASAAVRARVVKRERVRPQIWLGGWLAITRLFLAAARQMRRVWLSPVRVSADYQMTMFRRRRRDVGRLAARNIRMFTRAGTLCTIRHDAWLGPSLAKENFIQERIPCIIALQ
jgi:hypothetical protein